MALSWARNVVDTAGQPTPGPFKFWRVTRAAWIRACWEAFELSVGKEMGTLGLFRTWPALTLAFNFYGEIGLFSIEGFGKR